VLPATAQPAAEFDAKTVAYVNETADHRHDRAVRATAYFFQRSTGVNLGIVILDRLPPLTTIEAHADKLFHDLGLGRKSDGRALLFLWSEKERLFKIEVSYDLEDVFPDAFCKRMEEGARTFMLSTWPFARRDFLTELAVTMKLRYLEYRSSGAAPPTPMVEAGRRYVGDYLAGGGGVVGRGYAATLERVQMELKPLSPELEREMRPGRTPAETLERYLRLLQLGIGAPNVPLLTEASRYFRMDKPHAPGYLQRIRAYIANAGPPIIAQQGDLAVVSYRRAAPVLPIFMRRDPEGGWLVDEPKAWASLHLFQDGSHRLKYLGSPFAFGIQAPPGEQQWAVFGDRATPPPLVPMPTNLHQRLADAEARVRKEPNAIAGWIALADLLHFEIYWIQASEAVYQRILALDPNRMDIRWRLIDMHQMTSDIDTLNGEWCYLLARNPDDGFLRWHYKWLRRDYYWDAKDKDKDVCRDRSGRTFDS
jgi:hypothetical protein